VTASHSRGSEVRAGRCNPSAVGAERDVVDAFPVATKHDRLLPPFHVPNDGSLIRRVSCPAACHPR